MSNEICQSGQLNPLRDLLRNLLRKEESNINQGSLNRSPFVCAGWKLSTSTTVETAAALSYNLTPTLKKISQRTYSGFVYRSYAAIVARRFL